MGGRLRELLPGVLVATSREYATTSTVLLDGVGGALVVDPAWHVDELAAIPTELADLGATCVAGLATHRHYDHILWHPELGDVPRWSSSSTVAALREQRDTLLAPAREFLPVGLVAIAGRLHALPGDRLPWRGPSISLTVHDAHAPGHLAALVERPAVLLAGDMLSDVELPMPDDSDTTLERYLTGMAALRPVVAQAQWLIPGHGTPTSDPQGRWDADMRYLDALLAGREPDDPRCHAPGMVELHQANRERARRQAG